MIRIPPKAFVASESKDEWNAFAFRSKIVQPEKL